MNVHTTIDAAALLSKYLGANSDADLAQTMFAATEALLSAEASLQSGTSCGERHPERENSRNGYRLFPWDMRVGSIKLAVPSAAKMINA